MESSHSKDEKTIDDGNIVDSALKLMESQLNEMAGGLNNKLEEISIIFIFFYIKILVFEKVGKMEGLEKKIQSVLVQSTDK